MIIVNANLYNIILRQKRIDRQRIPISTLLKNAQYAASHNTLWKMCAWCYKTIPAVLHPYLPYMTTTICSSCRAYEKAKHQGGVA